MEHNETGDHRVFHVLVAQDWRQEVPGLGVGHISSLWSPIPDTDGLCWLKRCEKLLASYWLSLLWLFYYLAVGLQRLVFCGCDLQSSKDVIKSSLLRLLVEFGYVCGGRWIQVRRMTRCRLSSWQRPSSISTSSSLPPLSFRWTNGCSTPRLTRCALCLEWRNPSLWKTQFPRSVQNLRILSYK